MEAETAMLVAVVMVAILWTVTPATITKDQCVGRTKDKK